MTHLGSWRPQLCPFYKREEGPVSGLGGFCFRERIEGLRQRETYVPILLRFFKLFGLRWNLACRLFLCQKISLCFFSTSGETRLQTRSWKSTPPPPPFAPPPPPPPSKGVKHTHAHCFSSQRSKSDSVWRRTQGEDGGGDFRAIAFCNSWSHDPKLTTWLKNRPWWVFEYHNRKEHKLTT